MYILFLRPKYLHVFDFISFVYNQIGNELPEIWEFPLLDSFYVSIYNF